MSGALAVFLHELRARRPVLLATLVMSALIPIVALAPALTHERPSDVREVLSVILIVVFGYGLAVVYGASAFGGDLSEGRLGFYFARPIPGLSVWVGRTAALWCVIMCSELFALLPTVIANAGTLEFLSGIGWLTVPAFVVGPTLVLPLAHALSVMARARTWWLLLDVIGATVAGVAAWVALRSLVDVLNPKALHIAGGLLAATLLIALLSAGAAGTVAGRADLRRTHGALSLVLWLVVAAGWTGVGTYLRWLDAFGPQDLDVVSLEGVDPTGSWVEVRGSAASRFDTHRSFIVSTSDERWIALRSLGGPSWMWSGDVSFAADGRAAAWLGSNRDDDARTLWRVDLGLPRPVAVETTITTTSDADLELSADGRMAVLWDQGGLVSAYDLLDERLLAMGRVPAEHNGVTCTFPDTSTVRCFGEKKRAAETEPRLVLIHELDLASREIRRVAEINLGEHDLRPAFAAYSPSLLATIGCPGADCRLRFIDPGSGAIQRETALPAWARVAAVLADGRLVVRSAKYQDEILVAVQAEETATWTEHRAPAESFNWIGGEIAPGRLAIYTSRRDENGDWVKAQVQLLDLDTGATRPLGAGVDADAGWWWTHEDFWRTSSPMAWKPEAWRLFRTEDRRAVVLWDPTTGGLTTIAGRED